MILIMLVLLVLEQLTGFHLLHLQILTMGLIPVLLGIKKLLAHLVLSTLSRMVSLPIYTRVQGPLILMFLFIRQPISRGMSQFQLS